MKKVEYKNRYNDVHTFTLDDDKNILWEGNFEFCRIGMPNDYTNAYNQYVHDYKHSQNIMSFNQFKDAVHEYDEEASNYIYDKYLRMVKPLTDQIEMIDPSGGPYIGRGMNLESFGFKDHVVRDFQRIETGYKIIIDPCLYCGGKGHHKMGCETRKITILLDENEQ